MLSDVAFELVQLKTALCPAATFVGVAVSVTPRIFTVAVAVAVCPAEPAATALYVVAPAGTMVTAPESASAVWSSLRIDGVMFTDVALVLFHVSVAVWPAATTAGVIVNVIVGAAVCGTTVTTSVDVVVAPLALVAVAV
jgi:hypothetical protein